MLTLLASVDVERIRQEHALLLERLSTPLEAQFAAAARRVLKRALAKVNPSLVATGRPVLDLSALGNIPAGWALEVPDLGFAIADMYEGAGLESIVMYGGTSGAIPEFPDVVHEAAAEHMAVANNRLARVGDQMWMDARAHLETGIREGHDIDQMAENVQRTLHSAESRARTIARTETTRAFNAGSISGIKALGRFGPQRKIWLATRDDRTRDSHWIADGQRRAVGLPFQVGGYALKYPGDDMAPAAEVVNCRCTVIFEETGNEQQIVEETVEPGIEPEQVVIPPEDLVVARPKSPEEIFQEQIHAARVKVAKTRVKVGGRTSARANLVNDHREPTALMKRFEKESTAAGKVVDDEVIRRLEARGIYHPAGVEEHIQALREERSRVLFRRRESMTDVEHQAIDDESLRLLQEIFRLQDAADTFAWRDAYAATAREVLSEVLPMGADLVPSSASQAVAKVTARVGEHYPKAWVEKSNARDLRVMSSADRAGYWQYHTPTNGSYMTIPTSQDIARQIQTAIHEFGHRMEHVVDGVRQLEWGFYKRRTGKELLQPLSKLTGNRVYDAAGEVARPDKFSNPYMGKDYGGDSDGSWELFSMGMESLISPEVSAPYVRHYLNQMIADEDYRRWLLGVLLSAG